MAITTTTALGGLFNSIYERALFAAREMNIMTSLVTNYSARGWMARNISTRPTIAAESVNEGVDYANPTTFGKSTLGTLTPGEIIAQVVLTDRDIETDPDSARDDAVTELSGAVATKIDQDLTSVFASFGTDVGPGAGQAATIAKMAVAVSQLRNAKAPMPIYVVIHPYQWHDIWVLLGQPAGTYTLLGDVANQALRDFYVGTWLNVQWFTSANVVPSGTDATGGIFNPGAIAFDTRKPPTLEWERDASLRAWEANFSAGYAYGVRRDAFGLGYTSDVTTPS